MGMNTRSIAFYYTDLGERSSLEALHSEFLSRGWNAMMTTNLNEYAEIGVYGCGVNRLYNFAEHRSESPNNEFSVMTIHDLYQDNGDKWKFFQKEPWSNFDLALLPNQMWLEYYLEAHSAGIPGARFGAAVGGYPKADTFLNGKDRCIEPKLSDEKIKILVAASWQSRKVIKDLKMLRSDSRFEITVKSAPWSDDFETIAEGPWRDVLIAQSKEASFVDSITANLEGIKSAKPEMDIFRLLSECDVVISNGSNVSFEGLLIGKPGICVSDWHHPGGSQGQETLSPSVIFPGILTGESRELIQLIDLALSSTFRALVDDGKQLLINGMECESSAAKSADKILYFYENRDRSVFKDSKVKTRLDDEFDETFVERAQRNILRSVKDVEKQALNSIVENYKRDSAVAERDSAVAERDSAVAERDSAVAERDSAVAERDSILNSGIWKATKPYRWLRDKF
jgi:hypothetical protein